MEILELCDIFNCPGRYHVRRAGAIYPRNLITGGV
jgi:hypothetical protein